MRGNDGKIWPQVPAFVPLWKSDDCGFKAAPSKVRGRMRHFWFVLLLVVALFIALPPAIVWAMNECQLNPDQLAVEACFKNAKRGRLIYEVTLATGLLLSVGLHIARSRWLLLGLAALAFGPWLTMFI